MPDHSKLLPWHGGRMLIRTKGYRAEDREHEQEKREANKLQFNILVTNDVFRYLQWATLYSLFGELTELTVCSI